MATARKESLYISHGTDGPWAALVADRRLVEFHLVLPKRSELVGDIYLGRVKSVERRLAAAFVDIGREQPGFLPLGETPRAAVVGELQIVQVLREPVGGKGPRLTAYPTMTGARLKLAIGRRGIKLSERLRDDVERNRLQSVVSQLAPADKMVEIRAAASGASHADLAAELTRLQQEWEAILRRHHTDQSPACLWKELDPIHRLLRDRVAVLASIIIDGRRIESDLRDWCVSTHNPAADRFIQCRRSDWAQSPDDLRDQVRDGLEARVALPSGGSVLFEPGETLTAIDVDSGGMTAIGQSVPVEAYFLRVNLEAAEEIARQIRLRNIGGIIVIDFVSQRKAADQQKIVKALIAAVGSDSMACRIEPMSKLGLVEMTRKRQGPLLSRMTAGTAWAGELSSCNPNSAPRIMEER